MPKKREKEEEPTGVSIWLVLLGIFAVIAVIALMLVVTISLLSTPSDFSVSSGDVVVLPIEGVIVSDFSSSPFTGGFAVAYEIVDLIEEFGEDEDLAGMVLLINSPGGSPVASDEIGKAIKEFPKPVVAVIKETGASGGYWIASAADHIIANRMSITGSIGVVGSSFGIEGLLDDYNVTYRRMVAGKYKDAGTPFRDMEPEEEAMIQKMLDIIHEEFIKEVASNRNMDYDAVKELATGFVYLGSQAKENGLIDELGGMDEAQAWFEEELNSTIEFAYYSAPPSLLDLFASIVSENLFALGEGIGNGFGNRLVHKEVQPFMLK